jgi:hypothetical protein
MENKPIQTTKSALIHALTRYDAKQSTKRHYNRNALGIYFQRVDDIMADIERGADVRQAICAGFTGSVLAACLRALDLPKATDDEWAGHSAVMHYVPASS